MGPNGGKWGPLGPIGQQRAHSAKVQPTGVPSTGARYHPCDGGYLGFLTRFGVQGLRLKGFRFRDSAIAIFAIFGKAVLRAAERFICDP